MQQYLHLICRHLPAVHRVLLQHENRPLPEYLNSILKHPDSSYQPREDLLSTVYRFLKPLLGEFIANQAREELTRLPIVLTSSHTGIESYSIFIQGNILFALHALLGRKHNRAVVAFSFGNVPLNNRTYPRGLLLYKVKPENLDLMPVRLPIFPDRLKRTASSCAPPFSSSMIDQSISSLGQIEKTGLISKKFHRSVKKVLREEFLSEDILNLSSYSQQVVVLNNRIWKRLYADLQAIPELIYIEIESIVRNLMVMDLSNQDSLVSHVLFNPTVRDQVITQLDGISGCWHLKNLKTHVKENHTKKRPNTIDPTGTIFFWWIDEWGKKVPLTLTPGGRGQCTLKGIGGRGKTVEIAHSPDIIIEQLRQNNLLPSVFSCFLSFALARGVVCIGGCFQSDYLPVIQRAVCHALIDGGLKDVAQAVLHVKTDVYLPGMAGIMTQPELKPYLLPAGIFEILSGGGITSSDVDRLAKLTVGDAHCGAIFENLSAADPARFGTYQPGWKKTLAEDAYRYLNQKVVIK
ncbi:MAG TPA: hypothetical protein HPQ03_00050 [Deltaproteobacteria bacterium]|nr:hypothetical protein [Deltaproteobacteria bacterium]